MTPTGTGRHCAACQQVVVDFSVMTDGELAAHLSRSAGVPCGRFRTSQLGRPLLPAATPTTGWRRWLGAAAALLSLGTLAAQAQTRPGISQTQPGRPVPTPASASQSPPGQPAVIAPAGVQLSQATEPEPMVLGGMVTGAPIQMRAHPGKRPRKQK